MRLEARFPSQATLLSLLGVLLFLCSFESLDIHCTEVLGCAGAAPAPRKPAVAGSFRRKPRKQHIKSAAEIAELHRQWEAKQEKLWQAQRVKKPAKRRGTSKAKRPAGKAKKAAGKAKARPAAGDKNPDEVPETEVCILAHAWPLLMLAAGRVPVHLLYVRSRACNRTSRPHVAFRLISSQTQH